MNSDIFLKENVFYACCKGNNDFYFVTSHSKLIIKIDMDNNQYKFIDILSIKNNQLKEGLPIRMFYWDECLFIFYDKAYKIVTYDLKTGYIDVMELYDGYDVTYDYVGIWQFGSEFYFMLRENCRYLEVYDAKSKIKKQMNLSFIQEGTKKVCADMDGENLWVIEQGKSYIYKQDLKEKNVVKFKLPIKTDDVAFLKYYEHKIFIMSHYGEIWCWNPDTKKVQVFVEKEDKAEMNDYSCVAPTNVGIWMLPNLQNRIMRYDFAKDKLQEYKEYPKDYRYILPKEWLEVGNKFVFVNEEDEGYFFSMTASNYYIFINKTDGSIQWFSLPDMESEVLKYKIDQGILLHNEDYMLDKILVAINQVELQKEEVTHDRIGERIWEALK